MCPSQLASPGLCALIHFPLVLHPLSGLLSLYLDSSRQQDNQDRVASGLSFSLLVIFAIGILLGWAYRLARAAALSSFCFGSLQWKEPEPYLQFGSVAYL